MQTRASDPGHYGMCLLESLGRSSCWDSEAELLGTLGHGLRREDGSGSVGERVPPMGLLLLRSTPSFPPPRGPELSQRNHSPLASRQGIGQHSVQPASQSADLGPRGCRRNLEKSPEGRAGLTASLRASQGRRGSDLESERWGQD